MRTNVVIDDMVRVATLKATGVRTKREAVAMTLRTLLRLKQQTELHKLGGTHGSEGEHDAMRRED